jgi:hypothetical protein
MMPFAFHFPPFPSYSPAPYHCTLFGVLENYSGAYAFESDSSAG